ncbi:unnamed protein product [Diatraea saccharalis]|uniref:Uncharacterized protein n=1 Tax=Diatraea saccharalis TaxID=40085 RepID=A0A9N9RCV2_9NEOP|nr:unnamed protein product [Diatraea saccharalis]
MDFVSNLRDVCPRCGEVGGENNGFGSHTCGGLFAFGNKERNDKRKARARSHRLERGVGTRWGVSAGCLLWGGGSSLREQWRNNVQIAVSDAPPRLRCLGSLLDITLLLSNVNINTTANSITKCDVVGNDVLPRVK